MKNEKDDHIESNLDQVDAELDKEASDKIK